MALAIFDLDNTLIAGDSDHGWGEFLVQRNMVDIKTYQQQNDRFYQDYCEGRLDMDEYLAFSLKPLGEIPIGKLQKLHREFMLRVIEPLLLPKATQLLERHRQAGDYLLVVTSTNRFIVEPICKVLGVDDLIATEPEMIDGKYTGRLSGIASFGKGKVLRLNEWLSRHDRNLSGSFFYSDSINDLPLLLEVENPVAVDPDESLKREATNRSWPIISLR